jgi:hypothetical protein
MIEIRGLGTRTVERGRRLVLIGRRVRADDSDKAEDDGSESDVPVHVFLQASERRIRVLRARHKAGLKEAGKLGN